MTLSWFINKTAENWRFLAVFPRRRKEKHAAPFSLLTVSGSRVDVTPPDPHYQTLSWFWRRWARMTLIQIRKMEMPTSFLMYSNPQNLCLWWKAAESASGGEEESAVGSLHEKQSLISWVAHTHTHTSCWSVHFTAASGYVTAGVWVCVCVCEKCTLSSLCTVRGRDQWPWNDLLPEPWITELLMPLGVTTLI